MARFEEKRKKKKNSGYIKQQEAIQEKFPLPWGFNMRLLDFINARFHIWLLLHGVNKRITKQIKGWDQQLGWTMWNW